MGRDWVLPCYYCGGMTFQSVCKNSVSCLMGYSCWLLPFTDQQWGSSYRYHSGGKGTRLYITSSKKTWNFTWVSLDRTTLKLHGLCQWFQGRSTLGCLAMSRDNFGCCNWWRKWMASSGRAWDAANHPTTHRAATTQHGLAPRVHGARLRSLF